MANRRLRSLATSVRREVGRIVQRGASSSPRSGSATAKAREDRRAAAHAFAPAPPPLTKAYPGDFRGDPEIRYAPQPDGAPDPGEVVWAWVPYEEDHTQGKDRPLLLIGHDGPWLLALQLTSQDHDRDAAQERRAGRIWVDIGAGAWDGRRRPSEARVNRILRVDPRSVRREGAVLAQEIFDKVADAVHAHT